jgi:hypothetical protein
LRLRAAFEDCHLGGVAVFGVCIADAADAYAVAVLLGDTLRPRLELRPRPLELVVGVASLVGE